MTAREPRLRAEEGRRDGDAPEDGDGPGTRGAGSTPTARSPVRSETVTFDSQGVRCAADLYLPSVGEPPWPVVVMAHVFGAERGWGLAPFAERFAAAGFAAFVFDYRHLGGSDGEPRRLVDPRRQLDDWKAALAHVRSLEAVDGDRIGLWGTSFSGGHVLELARREAAVRAVVAQVPFVDGRATVAHQARNRSGPARAWQAALAVVDRMGAAVGLGPVELPFVSEPGGGGLVDSPGAMTGFAALVPEGVDLVNRTPARVVLDLLSYRPGRGAGGIDVPVHVVVAEEDRLLPAEPTERLIDRLSDPSVNRVPAAHFDVHRDPWFEPVAEEQVAFLAEALDADPGPEER